MTKGLLTTRKGEYLFEYEGKFHADHKAKVYYFEVWKENSEKIHRFSMILKEIEGKSDLKVIDLFAQDYQGEGISIPLILKAKKMFNKRIISSSNKKKTYYNEANWPSAIVKVWKPMVDQGLAKYDVENDFYYVL